MPPVPQRVLYWGSGSAPAWRAMIGLREKGLEYESKLLEMSKGEHKSPEVVALNPRGQVPTFVDQGVAVHESMAILQYLENVYPEPPLIPSDRAEKGQVIQRFHEVNALHQRMFDAVYLKFSWKGTPEQEELFAQKTAALKEELARWDKYLGDSKSGYIAGSAFSIADAALAPSLFVTQRFGATFSGFPNILKYMDKMKSHPSVAETWPPHWKGTEGKGYFNGA